MAITHDTISVVAGVGEVNGGWTLINTGGAVAGKVSLYALDGPVWIKVTTTAASPTTVAGALLLRFDAAIINQNLADLFPGLAAAAHIYAIPVNTGERPRVVISCA